jgi:hypothetical protein
MINELEHQDVQLARLDAAKFIIIHFEKTKDKPPVYEKAIAYIETQLTKR